MTRYGRAAVIHCTPAVWTTRQNTTQRIRFTPDAARAAWIGVDLAAGKYRSNAPCLGGDEAR